MPHAQGLWLGRKLDMQYVGDKPGPDLTDKIKVVEVKTGMTRFNLTLLNKQRDYHKNGKPCFLATIRYKLKRLVREVVTINIQLLEREVYSRAVYISEWKHVTSIPRGKCVKYTYLHEIMPPVTASYQTDKGCIHLTEGVPAELFKVDGIRLVIEPS